MQPEEVLRRAVREKYRDTATSPAGRFPYPVGRSSGLGLGYEPEWLAKIPDEVVDRFVGVGNPFAVVRPRPGQRILDVGCGCGFDVFVASLLVGPAGRAVGIDLTPEMVACAGGAAGGWEPSNLAFATADVESLPFPDGAFDLVISNGALNLAPDKDRALRELARVLRRGGRLAIADLLVRETVPPEVLGDLDAWSTWIAGALPGGSYLAKLEAAGFTAATILGPTGYSTSRYTVAHAIEARRGYGAM